MTMPQQPYRSPGPPTTWGEPGPSGSQVPRPEPTNEEIALAESGARRAPLPSPVEPRKPRRGRKRVVGGALVAACLQPAGPSSASSAGTKKNPGHP